MSTAVESPVKVNQSKASKHKKELHTSEMPLAQLPSTHEDEHDELESPLPKVEHIDKDARPSFTKAHYDQLAFNEDAVTISFSQSHERFAAPFVDCKVNGRGIEALIGDRWIEVHQVPVNKPVIIKRKYVEVFARCKHTDVKAFSTGGPQDGASVVNHTEPQSNLKHPFSVIHDPRGMAGHEWLNKILADRA